MTTEVTEQIAEIAAEERGRICLILGSPEANANRDYALQLALHSDIRGVDAIAMLGDAQQESGTDWFSLAMALEEPKVEPVEVPHDPDSVEAMVNKIVNS